MKDRFVLTPYFLDQFVPKLEEEVRTGWILNKPVITKHSTVSRILEILTPLACSVRRIVEAGDRPVSIAGDCCSAIGVMAGLHYAGLDPGLLWFDAHGDFNTWETTPSGFLGGMPLAMLVGRGDERLLKGLGLPPIVESRVLISDARDLDGLESETLQKSDIKHIPAVETLMHEQLPDGPLYVHFDTDFVSPREVPAQNYPAEPGPGSESVREAFDRISGTGRVVAVSISTWNPDLSNAGRSRDISLMLLSRLLSI